jgi:ABC-type dipeptide/oligopeptide/nickel transport system permease component
VVLVAVTVAIAAIDAFWIGLGAARPRNTAFAQASCGMGLGSVTSPEWSFFSLDPRTQSACESELFPVPGLACPDPTHGSGFGLFPARR